MKTTQQIDNALAAMALAGMAARSVDDEAMDLAAQLAVGALAWVIDDRGTYSEFREMFEQIMNESIADFDQAAAAVRDKRAAGAPCDDVPYDDGEQPFGDDE